MNTAEQLSERDPVGDVPPGFVDAVMRSIAGAPLPSPTRAFTAALHDRSRREAQGALGVAWRLLRAGAAMPMMVRAQALALLLLVGGSAIGGGALAAVATYRTVVPIVRSVVDPTADDGGVRNPALADPSPTATPSPTAAVAQPEDADAVNPDEPTSTGLDADDEVNDDAGEGEAGEPEGDDAEEGADRETDPDDEDEDADASPDDPDEESNVDSEEPDADGDGAEEPDADRDGEEDPDESDPDEDEPDDPDGGSGVDAPSGDEPDGDG